MTLTASAHVESGKRNWHKVLHISAGRLSLHFFSSILLDFSINNTEEGEEDVGKRSIHLLVSISIVSFHHEPRSVNTVTLTGELVLPPLSL